MTTNVIRRCAAFLYRTQRSTRSTVGFLLRRRDAATVSGEFETTGCLACDTNDIGRFVHGDLIKRTTSFPYPPNELMLMVSAVVSLRPSLIIEWGTNIGVSAMVFARTCERYRVKAEIHSVDLPAKVGNFENPGNRRGLLTVGTRVTLHEGDGVGTAEKIIRKRPGARLLVFVDGDHAEETVYREAMAIWNASPTAAILFHDTFVPACGEIKVVHGPGRAVDRVVKENPGRFYVNSTSLGRPGMTLCVPRC